MHGLGRGGGLDDDNPNSDNDRLGQNNESQYGQSIYDPNETSNANTNSHESQKYLSRDNEWTTVTNSKNKKNKNNKQVQESNTFNEPNTNNNDTKLERNPGKQVPRNKGARTDSPTSAVMAAEQWDQPEHSRRQNQNAMGIPMASENSYGSGPGEARKAARRARLGDPQEADDKQIMLDLFSEEIKNNVEERNMEIDEDEQPSEPSKNQNSLSAQAQPVKRPSNDGQQRDNKGTIIRVQAKYLIRKKDKNQVINVYQKFVLLMENLFTYGGDISLLPFDDNNHNNSITNHKQIPKAEGEFKEYCSDHHINRNGTGLYFIFKLKVNGISFYNLKTLIIPWLKQNGVFLYKTLLTSGHTCVVGWLKNSSPTLANKSTITADLVERFKTQVPFQITSRVLINGSIVTKSLAIECAINQSKELLNDIFTNYIKNKLHYINATSYKLQFIPTRPVNEITNNVIQRSMVNQNLFLRRIRRIIIRNVQSIDDQIPLPDGDGGIELASLRVWLQSTVNPNNDHLPFLSSVDTGPSDKIYLYTVDTMVSDAINWIKNLYKTHIIPMEIEDKIDYFGYEDPFKFFSDTMERSNTTSHANEIIGMQNENESSGSLASSGYTKPPVTKRPPQIIFSPNPPESNSPMGNAWKQPLKHMKQVHRGYHTASGSTATTVSNSISGPSNEDQLIRQLETSISVTQSNVRTLEDRLNKQAKVLNLIATQAQEQKNLIQTLDVNHRKDMQVLIQWMKLMAQSSGVSSDDIANLDTLCPDKEVIPGILRMPKRHCTRTISDNYKEQAIEVRNQGPHVSLSPHLEMIQ